MPFLFYPRVPGPSIPLTISVCTAITIVFVVTATVTTSTTPWGDIRRPLSGRRHYEDDRRERERRRESETKGEFMRERERQREAGDESAGFCGINSEILNIREEQGKKNG